jgi:hypothetical protein
MWLRLDVHSPQRARDGAVSRIDLAYLTNETPSRELTVAPESRKEAPLIITALRIDDKDSGHFTL